MITGASTPTQVRENLKALGVIPKLTENIYMRINEIFKDLDMKI